MLFYRLILLSWVTSSNILDGRLLQTQRLGSPLRAAEEREKIPQKLTRHILHPHYASASPNNVIGESKSLMTQVIASSMVHRGDHPRKFIDFLDNGAQWHRYISKPKGHKSELKINEGNYHVNLKYGSHDIDEADDRRNHNPDMYAGETISGENSLSKFTAPPVYDEEAAQYQRKTHLDMNYEADTPEAAATEKQNTEQFVNRLHSLMTPLSTPYEFPKGKGRKTGSQALRDKEQEESIYEQDDDDVGDYERNLPPVEAKPDRKDFSNARHVQKPDKQSETTGDRTMDIIKKYSNEDEDSQDNGGENKAERKEQIDENHNSNSYKAVKDDPYDRDYQDGYDARETSHWSRKENVKHSDEEDSNNNNNTERDNSDR